MTELPPPPKNKRGWSWTIDIFSATNDKFEISNWPKISVVTPCYNGVQFLEATIRSVIHQNYPNLEYIIIDGGSKDGSIEIIKKYEKWLSYWASEPDNGMYDAINKGFTHSNGEIMAWSPANDLYRPFTFRVVGSVFQTFPQVEWLTSLYKARCDENDEEIAFYRIDGFNKRAFYRGRNLLVSNNRYAKHSIPQQSTFWRRSLWEKSKGYLNDKFRSAGDFELWTRFFKYADLYSVDYPLSIFRVHQEQVSVKYNEISMKEQERAFELVGGQYMNSIESWLRSSILKKRPFRFLKYLPPVGYSAKIIRWNATRKRWEIHRNYFM